MTKEEMAAVLRKEGYPAEVVDGVLYIRKALSAKEIREMKTILNKAGYSSSYGFKRKAAPHRERPG